MSSPRAQSTLIFSASTIPPNRGVSMVGSCVHSSPTESDTGTRFLMEQGHPNIRTKGEDTTHGRGAAIPAALERLVLVYFDYTTTAAGASNCGRACNERVHSGSLLVGFVRPNLGDGWMQSI